MNEVMFQAKMPDDLKKTGGEIVKYEPTGPIDFSRAVEDVKYLRDLLGEVERRKFFATMCMTPEKICASTAVGLSKIISGLSNVTDDLSYKIKKLESRVGQLANKSDNLTNAEKQRIDKFLKRKENFPRQ